jgi:threonine/homoserine/homoserine lactone efflux protein
MDSKPKTIVSRVVLLAKKIAKGLLYALVALILVYLAFKAWEYTAESSQQQATKVVQGEQSEQFTNLSKQIATYSPLVVGGSSLQFVKRAINEPLFQYLLGSSYQTFITAMVYVGPSIFGAGCQKLGCTLSRAAYIIDPSKGRVYAAMIENGKTRYFGFTEGEAIPPAFESWATKQIAGDSK